MTEFTKATLVIFLLLISCSQFAYYVDVKPDSPSIHNFIEPGDKVKIITKDYEKHSFVVVDVTGDAILGENETVLFTNISELRKETISGTEVFWSDAPWHLLIP